MERTASLPGGPKARSRNNAKASRNHPVHPATLRDLNLTPTSSGRVYVPSNDRVGHSCRPWVMLELSPRDGQASTEPVRSIQQGKAEITRCGSRSVSKTGRGQDHP